MKKLFTAIKVWFVKKYLKVAYDAAPEVLDDMIVELYKQARRDEFVLKSEVVKVKKGKRRYYLLYIHSAVDTVRVWAGRRFEEANVVLKKAV